jgi:hypothetical protein
MSYGYPGSGRQVAGAADLARRRKEIERKEAVRRALDSRRGGVAAPAGYAAAPADLGEPPQMTVAQYATWPYHQQPPMPMARPFQRGAPAQAEQAPAKKWWEQETGPKKVGIPKHGKSLVAGIFDGAISLFIFAIAPAVLMSKAAQTYGLNLAPQIMSSVLIGGAIAGFAFLRWMFMRGTTHRLLLSIGQVLAVVVWIRIAISPNIDLEYYDVKIHIGLLRYLMLAAATYGLTALYYLAEYFVYKPMYEDIRRAKIAI